MTQEIPCLSLSELVNNAFLTAESANRKMGHQGTHTPTNWLWITKTQQSGSDFLHVGTQDPTDSPAWTVGEDNVAFLLGPLYKGHAGVLLPVPHGLAEYRPLAA